MLAVCLRRSVSSSLKRGASSILPSSGTAIATCPAGLKVISGGYNTTVPTGSQAEASDIQIFSSMFTGLTGWSVKAKNSAHPDSASLILTVYAICAAVQ